MTPFDRYAATFVIALAVISVCYGIKDYYREQRVAQIVTERDCWERKAQEHTMKYYKRRC